MENLSLEGKTLILGPVGSGKTTLLKQRYLDYINAGWDSSNILVLVMNRSQSLIWRSEVDKKVPGGIVRTSFFGFIQQQLRKYWPLILELYPKIGKKTLEPNFLSFEASQYLMRECIDNRRKGMDFFRNISIPSDRIAIELTATLSRASLAGIPYTQIGSRLKQGNILENLIDHSVYDEMDIVLGEYVSMCLENGCLDYGIATMLYCEGLLKENYYIKALRGEYPILLVDNLEEMAPAAVDLVEILLKGAKGALLCFCIDGGYSRFYGADPEYALSKIEPYSTKIELSHSYTCSEYMDRFANDFSAYIINEDASSISAPSIPAGLDIEWNIDVPLRSQMIDELNKRIQSLIEDEGMLPEDIAIIAPFIDTVLECSLTGYFNDMGIEVVNTSRKRRAMDNPYTNAMIVLACLSHPSYEILPSQKDIADTISLILDMDPVRSSLIARQVVAQKPFMFPEIKDVHWRERIGFSNSERYEYIRAWLLDYIDGTPMPIDHFFRRVFLEILITLPTVDENLVACNQLIDTAEAFIKSLSPFGNHMDMGREFVLMFMEGAKQSETMIDVESALHDNGILLTTPMQYLSTSRHKKVQVWCDIRSTNWTPRDIKVFTNPYILSNLWDGVSPMTETDEERFMRDKLSTLVSCLLKRCNGKVILTSSQYSSQGYEDDGILANFWGSVLEGKSDEREDSVS